jgi:hypothetical protein
MIQVKSSIAILMGIVILVSDVAWLVVGASYTYAPWLILGMVILVADVIWLGLDYSLMRESGKVGVAAKTEEEAYLKK